jgi:hypothetical protein
MMMTSTNLQKINHFSKRAAKGYVKIDARLQTLIFEAN